jgi:hypothetical protein
MDLRPVWESPAKVKKGIDGSQRHGELRGEGAPGLVNQLRAKDSGLTVERWGRRLAAVSFSVSEDLVGVREQEPKPICCHCNQDG